MSFLLSTPEQVDNPALNSALLPSLQPFLTLTQCLLRQRLQDDPADPGAHPWGHLQELLGLDEILPGQAGSS